MKLSEIFTQLTHGEFSQLAIGGGEAGEIAESNYPKVMSHVSLALIALYKRFPLREGRIVVPLVAGTQLYQLASVAPDLMKIEQVLTDGGIELALNDASEKYSVSTPTAASLRVPPAVVAQGGDLPEWLRTTGLELVYRANHPKIDMDDIDLDNEIELPYSHLEALLYYVASRVHNPVGMSNEFHAGNSYYAKYEASCQDLETKNLRVDQDSQNTKLQRGGWV